jgi:hypothetical protein
MVSVKCWFLRRIYFTSVRVRTWETNFNRGGSAINSLAAPSIEPVLDCGRKIFCSGVYYDFYQYLQRNDGRVH